MRRCKTSSCVSMYVRSNLLSYAFNLCFTWIKKHGRWLSWWSTCQATVRTWRFDAQNPNIIQVGILATGKPGTWKGQTRVLKAHWLEQPESTSSSDRERPCLKKHWAQSRKMPKTNLRSPHTSAHTCICTRAYTCKQIYIHTTYTFTYLHTHRIHKQQQQQKNCNCDCLYSAAILPQQAHCGCNGLV